jgi:hypothetical protein
MITPFRLAKLEVRPGDMVVLQTDLMLSKDQVQHLRDNMDAQLEPLKIKSVILVGGLKIGVLRKVKVT